MEVTVNKSALKPELDILAEVYEKKTTIPILANIKLEAVHGKLNLAATNLDQSITTTCQALTRTTGAICAPGKRLRDIVNNLPDGEITITVKDGAVTVKSGRSTFKMQGLPSENYPEIKSAPDTFAPLPADLFGAMVKQTVHAITNEESRYALNGGKLEIANGKARMIATDGHRLAFAEASILDVAPVDVLVPKPALNFLSRHLLDKDTVEIALSDNHLFAKCGERIFTSRLLTGQFPNYELVLPKENRNKFEVEVDQFAAALKRVALMADERSRAVKFEVGKDALKMAAQSAETGEAQEALAIEYGGPEMVLGLNAQYVLDVLTVLSGGKVSVEMKDGNSQVLLRPVATGEMDSRFVIMPMRM